MAGSHGIAKRYRYDPSPILGSKSTVAMILGARRFGKTYAFVRNGIRQYLKHDLQWVYLRRYDQELKDTIGNSETAFFNPFIRENEFPGYLLRVHGRVMEIKAEGEKRYHTMGTMMALSKAANYKGRNSDGLTGSIVFDEFIKERRVPPYLPHEPEELIGLWATLDGYNDTAKIYMLANAADIVNPYFLEWQVPLPRLGTTQTVPWGEGSLTIQYADSADFREQVAHTNIGKFVAGSSFERYAIDNRFAEDTDNFIAKKTSSARYAYSFVFGAKEYGIWIDYSSGIYYVTKPAKQEGRSRFVLLRKDMRPNTLQLARADPVLRLIRTAWTNGYLYFDSVRTRETFLQKLDIIGVR